MKDDANWCEQRNTHNLQHYERLQSSSSWEVVVLNKQAAQAAQAARSGGGGGVVCKIVANCVPRATCHSPIYL